MTHIVSCTYKYRIGIDEWLRVPAVEDVFALGDCAGFLEHTGRPVLPALAQVAERQGKYLMELFNTKIGKQNGGKAYTMKDVSLGDPFVYKHLGSMASVGRYKALVDLRQSKVTIQSPPPLNTHIMNLNSYKLIQRFCRMQRVYLLPDS